MGASPAAWGRDGLGLGRRAMSLEPWNIRQAGPLGHEPCTMSLEP